MNNVEITTAAWSPNGLPATLSEKTRRAYDAVAPVYRVSTMLFHSRAHRCVLEFSGIRDGMRVLEVATGSGEMFRRLVQANRAGATVGIDLSPKMAAQTQRHARGAFPGARAHCQAVDARNMPFRDASFDAVVCCYLLELLAGRDIVQTVQEFHRVLRPNGRLALVLIGQNTAFFNGIYRVLGKVAPAFWGRQVERCVPDLIEAGDFRIVSDRTVRQSFYPSRVLVARRR